jgi:diguanylate cyclase (GGDEF)-like protein
MTEPKAAPFLVQIAPASPTLGTRHLLLGPALLLGRDPDCDVCVEAATVAEQHARIERRADGYYAVDLTGSAERTTINGSSALPARLVDGDQVRVGEAVYRFFEPGGVEAAFHEEVHRRVNTDFLTGVASRRHFLNGLERELRRARRYGRALAVIRFDIDHFRDFNTTWGHDCGDEILRQLADCVQGTLREEALLGRLSGEEFAVLLPEADLEAGVQVAERIRAQVERHSFLYAGSPRHVTISLGVAALPSDDAGQTCEMLLKRADVRMYQAKWAGRNQVAPPMTR